MNRRMVFRVVVRHLAHAGDRPAIGVMARAADGTYDYSARVVWLNNIQTIGTARLFRAHDVNFRHPLGVPPPVEPALACSVAAFRCSRRRRGLKAASRAR